MADFEHVIADLVAEEHDLDALVVGLEDEGWDVLPLLVVRDVRSVFRSLLGKDYGSNGITAEEPPLRMRLRRFEEDWNIRS